MTDLQPRENAGDSGSADARSTGDGGKPDGPVTEETKAGLLIERLKAEFAQSNGPSAGLEELKRLKKEGAAPTVLKTFLDLDACRQVAYTMASEKEARLKEELESRPVEPAKPFVPINNYKQSLPCSSMWDKLQGTERVRFCSKCSLQVYDFSKVELPEAEEIIFQKEGKRQFVLFKRPDGKFLTANCPVAVKNQYMMMTGIAVGVLVVGGLIILMALNPPQQPAVNPQPVTSSVSGSDNSVENEKPAVKAPASSPASTSPAAEPQETFSQRLMRSRGYAVPVNNSPPVESQPAPDAGQVIQQQPVAPAGQINQPQPYQPSAGPAGGAGQVGIPQAPAAQAPAASGNAPVQPQAPAIDSSPQSTNQAPAAPGVDQPTGQQNPYVYQAPNSN